MSVQEQSAPEVKHQILDAAQARFGRYGFGKTTMAEIAGDCGMSAGNLYRYYKNKSEIGAACAERCMRESERLAREVVEQPGLSAKERLSAFVLTKMNYMHQQFCEHEPLFELVQHISEARADLVQRHWETLQSLTAEILVEGKRTGEFEVEDILSTARTVLLAVYKFISPHHMASEPLALMEEEARQVLALVVRAIERR
ncbi:MAG: TetR/AcrR family transcriptional regulator [Nitrospinaceae bacterium]